VLHGNGDGTFAASKEYPFRGTPGGRSSGLAVGDLNGDGIPDLVVANGNVVSVVLGNPDGTLRGQTDVALGRLDSSTVVSLADLNGDGHLDIVSGNQGSDDVSVLMGAGDGSFGAATDYTAGLAHAFGPGPTSVAIGDVNGDGHLDIVTGNWSYFDSSVHRVSVLLNQGDGTFAPQATYAGGNTARQNTGPAVVALGDLNGDGELDIVSAGEGRRGVEVLMNLGKGIFPAAGDDAPVEYDPDSVVVADVNQDGFPDLVTGNQSGPQGSSIAVLLGNGDGTLGARTYYKVGGLGSYDAAATAVVGDVNGDGIPDIIAVNPGYHSVSVILGQGGGAFGPAIDYEDGLAAPGGGPVIASVALADLNGDGRLDIVTCNPIVGNSDISVLLNNGNGTFSQPMLTKLDASPSSLALADLGGHGTLDLVCTIGDTIRVIPSNGDGTFGNGNLNAGASYATGTHPVAVMSADLNGDGHPDLVTVNKVDNTVSVLLNNGDGTFAARADYAVGDSPTMVAVADVNGDGVPDLLTTNSQDDTVSVLLGQAHGTFAGRIDYAVGNDPVSLALDSLTADGPLFLITANPGGQSISLRAVLKKT
jgi:hypothetical protein